jgi:hypothetical protein
VNDSCRLGRALASRLRPARSNLPTRDSSNRETRQYANAACNDGPIRVDDEAKYRHEPESHKHPEKSGKNQQAPGPKRSRHPQPLGHEPTRYSEQTDRYESSEHAKIHGSFSYQ